MLPTIHIGLLVVTVFVALCDGQHPNIVFIVADDLGKLFLYVFVYPIRWIWTKDASSASGVKHQLINHLSIWEQTN